MYINPLHRAEASSADRTMSGEEDEETPLSAITTWAPAVRIDAVLGRTRSKLRNRERGKDQPRRECVETLACPTQEADCCRKYVVAPTAVPAYMALTKAWRDL